MCRQLAYVGAPVPLADAVLVGSHSLLRQSYAARELLSGVVCADGFGVGWYDEHGRAARYRSIMPIWADANLADFGAVVRSGHLLASVRNATPGMPFGEAAVHPLRDGDWLFCHNGSLRGDKAREELRALAPADVAPIGSDTGDLFGALVADLRAGVEPAAALRGLIGRVAAHGEPAWLNLALSDGRRTLLTRFASDGPAPSLYLHAAPDAVRVASEPLDDDPGWEPVAPSTLVELSASLRPVLSPI